MVIFLAFRSGIYRGAFSTLVKAQAFAEANSYDVTGWRRESAILTISENETGGDGLWRIVTDEVDPS